MIVFRYLSRTFFVASMGAAVMLLFYSVFSNSLLRPSLTLRQVKVSGVRF